MIGEAISQELIAMELEIPWLKRFDEKPQENAENDEQIDFETMLMELEYR